jgi:hypothetical protein
MMTARAEQEPIMGVAGVRFKTNAKPKTGDEDRLKEIQYQLSGGQVDLPSPTTVAHLSLYYVDAVDGSTRSPISLWVPATQRPQAAELLEAADFTVL